MNAAVPILRGSTHRCQQQGPRGSHTLCSRSAAHPKCSHFNTRGKQMSFVSRTWESNQPPWPCGQRHSAFSKQATSEPGRPHHPSVTSMRQTFLRASSETANKLPRKPLKKHIQEALVHPHVPASLARAGGKARRVPRGHLSTTVPKVSGFLLAPATQPWWAEVCRAAPELQAAMILHLAAARAKVEEAAELLA